MSETHRCPYCGTKRQHKSLCETCSIKLKLVRELLSMRLEIDGEIVPFKKKRRQERRQKIICEVYVSG